MSDRNMKNIHWILEKTGQCEPYAFAKANTIALIWQLLSSIFITKFWNMFEHHVLVLHENKEHGIFTCSIMKKLLKNYFFTFSTWCKNRTNKDRRYIWYKICVDTIAIRYRVQTLYKKRKINKNCVHLNISVICC